MKLLPRHWGLWRGRPQIPYTRGNHMENSFNKYQNKNLIHEQQTTEQPTTYGEYLRRKKLAMGSEPSCSKSVDSTSQRMEIHKSNAGSRKLMNSAEKKANNSRGFERQHPYSRNQQTVQLQHKNTNNANKTRQNNPRQIKSNSSGDIQGQEKCQQPKTYEEYLRSRQSPHTRDKPIMQNNTKQMEANNPKFLRNEDMSEFTRVGKNSTTNKQPTSDNSGNITKSVSDTAQMQDSNTIHRGIPRRFRKRRQCTQIIKRLSNVDPNTLTEAEKSDLKFAETRLENLDLAQLTNTQDNKKAEKRPKTNILMIVLDRSSPDGSISKHNWEKLEEKVAESFYEAAVSKTFVAPVVRDAGLYMGRFHLLSFGDIYSKKCYKETLRNLGEVWPKANLNIVYRHEIPTRPAASAWIPTKPETADAVLQLIRDSNPDLSVQNWSIAKFGKSKGHRRQIVISLDENDLSPLEESAFVISYAFGQIDLKTYRCDKDLWRVEKINPLSPTNSYQADNSSSNYDLNYDTEEDLECYLSDSEEGTDYSST